MMKNSRILPDRIPTLPIVLLAMLVLSGCTDLTGPDAGGEQVPVVGDPRSFVVEVAMDRSVYPTLDEVSGNVTIRNGGGFEAEIPFQCTSCPPRGMILEGANGTRMGLSLMELRCCGESEPVVLAPGGVYDRAFRLGSWCAEKEDCRSDRPKDFWAGESWLVVAWLTDDREVASDLFQISGTRT